MATKMGGMGFRNPQKEELKRRLKQKKPMKVKDPTKYQQMLDAYNVLVGKRRKK